MARMIEGVTERLLQCAKEEFLAKGYENASLRAIAEKAGSSKSSILYRYQDKENLYRCVVRPVTDGFCAMMQNALEAFSDLPSQEQEKHRHHDPEGRILVVINYIYENLDEFKIMLTSGETVLRQGFMDKLAEIESDTMLGFIEKSGNDALLSGRLTLALLHILSHAFYSGVFEVVVHGMEKEEAVRHIRGLSLFYNAGWEKILSGGDCDCTDG